MFNKINKVYLSPFFKFLCVKFRQVLIDSFSNFIFFFLPSSKMWLQNMKHQRQGRKNAFKNFNIWTLVMSSLDFLQYQENLPA